HQPWRYAAAPAGYRREPPRTAAVRHPGEVGVMDSMRYVIILAACVVVTLPLEFVLGARVYRRPKLLIATLAPIAGVFLAWDLIATARGHWWFTDRYLLGPRP